MRTREILVFLFMSNCVSHSQQDHVNSFPTVRKISEESIKNWSSSSENIIDSFFGHTKNLSDEISEGSPPAVKVMIRNVNSGLVLDGSDFVLRVEPLVGSYTQLWTFNKSSENPEAIIFTNVANGRALYSWPYTRSVFCYDWADTVYTRWFLGRDRRLVSAAYPQQPLYYGYGPLSLSLRYGVSSDGTDEWVLAESKEDSVA